MKGFGIEIKNNLLEPKHVDKMGTSVWLFMWLLDHVTSSTEQGEGIILGGKPIKFEEIKKDLGISPDTYTRWREKLLEYPYISATRTPYGMIFKVYKIHKRFGNRIRKIAESNTEEVRNLESENAESNKTVTVRQNSKTISQQDLKKQFWDNSLFKRYQQVYPGRNYDLCFEEMCQWYLVNKKRLPQVITAFGKWLSNTKPQMETSGTRTSADETKKMLAELSK